MTIDKISKSLEYFDYFSKKDLDKLSLMFEDNIELIDWNICVSGKNSVLIENKKIFDTFENILIKPLTIAENTDTVMANIHISLNHDISLNVVDMLKFNIDGKIVSIKAFKQ